MRQNALRPEFVGWRILIAVPLPIILYNVPSRTATNMSAETTIRLSQIDVVGQVPSGTAATTGPYGTTLVEDRSFQGLRMLRYRTNGLITLTAAALREWINLHAKD